MLDPELRKLIHSANAKASHQAELATGVIQFDERQEVVHAIARLINEALTGPAIGVLELAEQIVDTVDGYGY